MFTSKSLFGYYMDFSAIVCSAFYLEVSEYRELNINAYTNVRVVFIKHKTSIKWFQAFSFNMTRFKQAEDVPVKP